MLKINKISDQNKLQASVLTFGNFDGIHLGHIKIIKKLKQLSLINNTESVIVTFRPNTKKIVNDLKSFKTLISFDIKRKILNNLDIDILCEIDFNQKFSNLSASSFIDLLIEKYNPLDIVLGYDNKFGKKGLGSYEFLIENTKYKHINFHKVSPYEKDDVLIKTSNIKFLIKSNDILTANKHLGRKFSLYGFVVEGEKVARTLGYPTANIKIERKEQLIPSNGVYSVNLIIDNVQYNGICNIGKKPTFGKYERTIEVHLLKNNLNIYGKYIQIEFNYFIRLEKKFKNKEELSMQISKDIKLISNKEKNSVK